MDCALSEGAVQHVLVLQGRIAGAAADATQQAYMDDKSHIEMGSAPPGLMFESVHG